MKKQSKPMNRLLISRTDHIGDVVLSLPMAAWIKQHYPQTEVVWLGAAYTQAIVARCPSVDGFIDWDALQKKTTQQQIDEIRSYQFDAVLHVYPKSAIASLMKKCRIPLRIGTSRRWYHWLTCNVRPHFTRARSVSHEAALNLRLLQPLGFSPTDDAVDLAALTQLRDDIPDDHDHKIAPYLDPHRFNLIIHPFSNSSGREWPLSQFIALIHDLPDTCHVIVTGSPSESSRIKSQLIPQCQAVTDTSGCLSLDELVSLIQRADGLIASSTGPLHIAAAAGIHALGLYPPKPIMGIGRWGPIGRSAQAIALDKDCQQACDNTECPCMAALTVSRVKQAVMQWLPAAVESSQAKSHDAHRLLLPVDM